MTANRHFKQLVRARMAATNETYSAASDHLRRAVTDVVVNEPITLDVHGRHGQAVVFTADGGRLLSGGQDSRIVLLDARTGETVGELLGHDKVVNALAIGEDASTVVSASSDRTVRVWDLTGQRNPAVLEGHRDAVTALALVPGTDQAVSGGYDGRLRRWDLTDGRCVDEQRSPLKRIAALAATSDMSGTSRTLESGQGPMVFVRDEQGGIVAELDTGAPGVTGLAVAPGGAMVATAGYDGTVGLWSTDGFERIRELRADDRVNALAFSREGQLLAAAVAGRVMVWSSTDEEPVATYDLPIKGVYALAFSPDTRRLAQTGADGKVRIWTLR